MRIKRRLPVFFGVLLVIAAVALAVVLRKHAPPEPARLLPGADGFFYVNLQWMRRADISGPLPAVPHDAEYEQFVQETGFQFERDLDKAAFAIHYGGDGGKNGASSEPRFSEVFVGKIDGERFRAYLRKISNSTESYRSTDIYNIPLDGRTVRVAILSVDTVAVSNHNDPQVIHGIVDRSRKIASPFGGPALLRQHYKHVPFASLVWGIFKANAASENALSSQAGNSSSSVSPFNLSFLFAKPAVIVTSVRYFGAIHFRAEAFTGSEEAAQRLTEQLSTFLTIFRAAEISVGQQGPDPDVKQFFESLKVDQHKDRTELTANLPTALIRKLVAAAPNEITPQAEPQAPSSTPPDSSPKPRRAHAASGKPATPAAPPH
jgi:hypothetical protein